MTRVRALKTGPDEIDACNGVTLAPCDPGRAKRLAPVLVSVLGAYFNPSWTPFQADRGRHFSVIVDAVSAGSWTMGVARK